MSQSKLGEMLHASLSSENSHAKQGTQGFRAMTNMSTGLDQHWEAALVDLKKQATRDRKMTLAHIGSLSCGKRCLAIPSIHEETKWSGNTFTRSESAVKFNQKHLKQLISRCSNQFMQNKSCGDLILFSERQAWPHEAEWRHVTSGATLLHQPLDKKKNKELV